MSSMNCFVTATFVGASNWHVNYLLVYDNFVDFSFFFPISIYVFYVSVSVVCKIHGCLHAALLSHYITAVKFIDDKLSKI